MEIPKKIKDEIWEYCRLNDISNVEDFMIKMLTQGYTIEKYGSTPLGKTETVEVIKEVPVEKIVEKTIEIVKEVPVEKIVEKEIIKEVEVIKEIPIEVIREVFVTDDEVVNNLQKELENIKNRLSTSELTMNNEIESLEKVIEGNLTEIEILNEKTKTLVNEKNVLLDKNTQLVDDLRKEKEMVYELTKSNNDSIVLLNEEINLLKSSLEEEKKKHNKNNDIYGEERKSGWFGSNLRNRR